MYVSHRTADHFDFVLDDDYIFALPDPPDRWPDSGNGGRDREEQPPTVYISTSEVFIATQPGVTTHVVEQYVHDLINGDDMPPIAALKCRDGIIVWNGHHRVASHRLAGRKTIPVRIWCELDRSFAHQFEEALEHDDEDF